MIRLTALWVVVFGLVAYARRDWYVSLCGLILTMAVIEHPDVPRTMFDTQGLNFWNILLAVVVVAWYRARKREGLTWDLPRGITLLLLLYLGAVLLSFGTMMLGDRSYIGEMTTVTLISEYIVNTVKWVVPGLLLFDGCRSRRRFYMAVASVLGVFVLLSLYVIRWMPLEVLTSGDEMQRRALKILVNEIGYHRVTMSMMLAGASWAMFSARFLAQAPWQRAAIVAATAMIVFAQALTGGRMGYVTWGAIGIVLLTIRGRGYLLLAPVFAMGVLLLVPAVGQRLFEGFDPSTSDYAARAARLRGENPEVTQTGVDFDTVTAGRTVIWPYVMDRVADQPLLGYGMLAMPRTGLTSFLATSFGEGFDHPHNAYLERLLDGGVIGLAAVLPFYGFVIYAALRLYADRRSPIFAAAGGITLSFVLALLVAGIGSQSFYPREASVGMWCAIGLMLRVWVERHRVLAAWEPAAQAVPLTPPPPARMTWPGRDVAAASAPAAVAAPAPAVMLDERLWQRSA